MFLSPLCKLLNQLSPPSSSGRRKAHRPKIASRWPRVEYLEDRTLLAAGALDAAFGAGGLVKTGFFSSASDSARAVVIQPDGRVVVAGTSNGDFAVARYSAQGVLDLGFDGDGQVTTDFGATDEAFGVAVQTDGKIVVVGRSGFGPSNFNFAVARYNTNGSLDTTTFGNYPGNPLSGTGKVVTDFAFGNDQATGVVIQTGGKIVVVGTAVTGGTSNFALARYNTDGSLDTTTFGNYLGNPLSGTGKVVTDFGSSQDQANAVVVQSSDGKIVVVGSTSTGSNTDFAIARYDGNGVLDLGFDGDGKVTTDFAFGSNDQATGVVVQSSGKIVVAGSIGRPGPPFGGMVFDFALARYNVDGSLDTTFGGSGKFGANGKVITDFGSSQDQVFGVAVQSDDRIVVAGSTQLGTSDFAVARYDAQGFLDGSFGAGGKAAPTDFGSSQDQAFGVVLQGSNILLAGVSGEDFALARYGASGTLDGSFDGDGKLTTDFLTPTRDTGQAVVIQPDGKIVVAGSAGKPGGPFGNLIYDFALARYNPDGSLDTTFGTGGRVTTDFGGNTDEAFGLALQTDGKILVAGRSGSAFDFTSNDFALARYNLDGSLDTTFDGDGKVTTDFGGNADQVYGVAVQPDGKIVVSGWSIANSVPGGENFALARYNPNGSLDTSFDGDGKVTTDFFGNTEEGRGMVLQPDGKIVVAGLAYTGTIFNLAVARYNPNGSLDAGFDGDGRFTTTFGGVNDQAQAVALQPDGKIVAAGRATPGGSEDFGLVRLKSDGSLDTAFGTGGKVTTDFAGRVDEARGLVVQPDGRIVVAGSSAPVGPGSSTQFALARYNANGSLDSNFGTGGKVTNDFGGDSTALGVARQGDGNIVAAGLFGPSGGSFVDVDFAVARYLLPQTRTWDGGGTTDNWMDRFNWVGDVAPNPIAGDSLIFPAGTPRTTPFNDFTSAVFASVSFTGSGPAYTINGNPLGLTTGITNDASGTQTLNVIFVEGAAALTIDGGGRTLLNGAISGSGDVIKSGAGELDLAGTNGYSGTTRVNAGVVSITQASALGTTAGETVVAPGAALWLNGTFSVVGEALTLQGDAGGAGALQSIAGVNEWTGVVTLLSNAAVGVAAAPAQLTLSGKVTGLGGLTKAGPGSLTLGGLTANDYGGVTTVNAGTLVLAKPSTTNAVPGTLVIGDVLPLGSVNADQVVLDNDEQIQNFSAVTVNSSGKFDFNGKTETIGALTVNGGNVDPPTGGSLTVSSLTMTGGSIDTGTGTLNLNGNVTTNASATSATIAGNVNLGSATRTFTIADNVMNLEDMVISAVISGTGVGLTKAGSGTLKLTGNNNYTAATTINGGVLEAGTATALPSATALTMTFAGTLQVDSPGATIGSFEGAGTVKLDGTLTTGGNDRTTFFSGRITGAGGLTKVGAGSLGFSGSTSNDYTGVTRVNAGTLDLGMNGIAIPGDLVIGDDVRGTLADFVSVHDFDNQIAPTAAVTINSSGDMQLGTNQTFGSLTMVIGPTFSADVHTAFSGVLTLGGDVTVNSLPGTTATSPAAMIQGSLNLGTATRKFTIADGAAADDMVISAAISGTGGLTKEGPGTLVLGGGSTNLYTGTTTVNEGALRLRKSAGVAVRGALIIGDGLGGANADQVVLDNDEQILGTAPVTVNSSGTFNYNGKTEHVGLLAVIGGHVDPPTGGALTVSALSMTGGSIDTGTGALILEGDVIVNASPTSATISGNLDLGSMARTFTIDHGTATDDMVISAFISGTGGLTKGGTGTLTLMVPSLYTGPTHLIAGSVRAGADMVFAPLSDVTVELPAKLDVNGKTEQIGSLAGEGDVFLGTDGHLKSGGSGASTVHKGQMHGAGGQFTKEGTGTHTVQGKYDYTGPTHVAQGKVKAGADMAFPELSDFTVDLGATADLDGKTERIGSLAGEGDFELGPNGHLKSGGSGASTVHKGQMHGTGGQFTKEGSGTHTIAGKYDYTGPTHVAQGKVKAGADMVFPEMSDFTADPATTVDLDGKNQRIGSLAGSGDVPLGSATLTTGGSGLSTTYNGTISGTGGVIKQGADVWTLTADNTYTSPTGIEGGPLIVNGDQPNSQVFVGPDGTLGGYGTVGDLTSDGVVSPGTSPGILTVQGNYTQRATGVLNIEIGGFTAGTEYDQLVVTGVATLGGTLNVRFINGFVPAPGETFQFLTAASFVGDFAVENGLDLGNGLVLRPVFSASGLTLQTLISSSTTLASSANPSVFGQSVTLTAAVSTSASGSGVPTGTVTFYDGSTALGIGTLQVVGGIDQATFTTSALAVGSHGLTAVYAGGGNFLGSTSPALSQTVNPADTTTAVSSSAATSVVGQTVTFTVTVSPVAPGAGMATGTVTFYDGTNPLGTATLSGGTASFSTASLAEGSHAITVAYGGDANFNASTSPALTQTVNPSGGSRVGHGQTATIGFWHNKNGQALINSFNGGPSATALGNWLAATFSNLYGSGAGANNLAGKTNAQVAAFYQPLFGVTGQKLDAQVLATALNVYATTLSLGGTAAVPYGFTVTAAGVGASTWNVGTSGAAFGVANKTVLTVSQILQAANEQAVLGVLYNGKRTLRNLANAVFDGINQAGDIN